jgi:hypothetical protein
VIALSELLVSLVDAVPADAGGPLAGVRLAVAELALALPIEARLGGDGSLRASPPRGRLATGFDPPHGRLEISIARTGDDA